MIRSATVEQSRACMGEPPFGHQVVGLDSTRDVVLVDPNANSHEHVLGTLRDLSINTKQIASFQRLEPEEVIVLVARVVDCGLVCFSVLADDLEDVVSDQRSWSSYLVGVIVQICDDVEEGVLGHFVEI